MTGRAKGKRSAAPVICIEGCTVRIIGDVPKSGHVPRRQSFAWAANAQEYAERLSLSRGWAIEPRG
jgi:hypothetical protein